MVRISCKPADPEHVKDIPDNMRDLFERYLNNECSPEEIQALLRSFETAEDELPAEDGRLPAEVDELLWKKHLRAYLDADKPLPKEDAPRSMDGSSQPDRSLDEDYIRIRERIERSIDRTDEIQPNVRSIGDSLLDGYYRVDRADRGGYFPWIGHRRSGWQRVAAILLFLVIGAGFYFAYRKKPVAGSPPVAVATDIRAGSYKATLTLANGTVIALDSAGRVLITQQGPRKVINLGGRCLTYDTDHAGAIARTGGVARAGAVSPEIAPLYNTVSTPKGGEYQVILPDGSKVWLNAMSSLRFPMVFDGPTRDITLEGEAYFEIAPRAGRPFRVHVREMTVDVLGTHFNIMAYPDEQNIRTSLLEGAVKILAPTSSRLLKPGQQSRYNAQNGELQVKEGGIEEAMAWKNGFFLFHEDDIGSVMRQVARWYDVDVRYEGKAPEASFSGSVSRSMPLSQVIKILQLSAVHIKLEGKILSLMP
jgi:transmembrane sensor